MDIAKLLRRNIKKQNVMLKDIATGLGITPSALTQQINNETISFANVVKIASIINCDLVDLVDDKDTPGVYVSCPHCGAPINLKITADKGI